MTLRKKLQKYVVKFVSFIIVVCVKFSTKNVKGKKECFKNLLYHDRKALRRDYIGENVFLGKENPFLTGENFEAVLMFCYMVKFHTNHL